MKTFPNATDGQLGPAWDALRGERPSTMISEIYEQVADVLAALPGFEYPNWSHRTVGDLRKAIANSSEV